MYTGTLGVVSGLMLDRARVVGGEAKTFQRVDEYDDTNTWEMFDGRHPGDRLVFM